MEERTNHIIVSFSDKELQDIIDYQKDADFDTVQDAIRHAILGLIEIRVTQKNCPNRTN